MLHFISLLLFHSLLLFIPFYFPFCVSLSHDLLTKDKAPSKQSSKSLTPVHFDFIFLNRLPPSPCCSPIRHHWTGFHTTGRMTHTAWSLRSVSVTLTTSWVAGVAGTAVVSVGALPVACPPAGLSPLHVLVYVLLRRGRRSLEAGSVGLLDHREEASSSATPPTKQSP